MTSAPIATRVTALVGDITAQNLDAQADGERSLRDIGVSSLRMIELIGTLETAFDFRIGDDEIDEGNFGTLSALIGFVEGKARR
jgi:acyl carrier protein